MTKDNIRNLLVEWNHYELKGQKEILLEYLESGGDLSNKGVLLNFLKEKMSLKPYRKTVGLA